MLSVTRKRFFWAFGILMVIGVTVITINSEKIENNRLYQKFWLEMDRRFFNPIRVGSKGHVCAGCHVWISKEAYELEIAQEKNPNSDLGEFWKRQFREKKLFTTGYFAAVEVIELKTLAGTPAARIRITDGQCLGKEGWIPAFPGNIFREMPTK